MVIFFLLVKITDSAQAHRHEDLLTVTLDQQCNRLRVPAHHTWHPLDRVSRLAIDSQQDIVRLHAAPIVRSTNIFDHQAVAEFSGTAFLPGRQTKCQAEPSVLVAGGWARCKDLGSALASLTINTMVISNVRLVVSRPLPAVDFGRADIK